MTTIQLLVALAGAHPFAVAVDSPPPAPVAPQTLRAIRLNGGQSIAIDGVLRESLWQTAERITGFTQRDPNEGAVPSESTVVYIAYDDAALYIGARLYDSHPDSIVARLARRDENTSSDHFQVFIDPYHDKRSGFYFGISAAGTLSDGTLFNDDWDDNSWDGVWEGKVTRDALGWVAELRIPYSQLRFVKQSRYVWGINFRRDIARRNEFDYIVFTPKNGSGFVSRFPDLIGIEQITPPRRVEVMPYATTR
ncbi:MAG TPA: carbohydrate binding family 9 domain-containing protein, partial [Gemmatimonadales bacterium]|nr:carbohydrate binding family 9 domain-containing protein [Gemmatimonadales bacterium]